MRKRITAIIFLLVLLIGIIGYASIDKFIKPVAWQLIKGYSNNVMQEDSTSYDKVVNVRNRIEDFFKKELYPKNVYINLYGAVNNVVGNKFIADANPLYNVVKLNNNYLVFVYPKSKNIAQYAQNLIELNTYLKQKDIALLYIQAPNKINKFDNQLPTGVDDFTNSDADEFLQTIRNSGVDTMDFREIIHDNKINHFEMFFKTDHHWKPEAGLWATEKLSEKLVSDYNFKIDTQLYDPKNYNVEVKKNWFLGSLGKRVGLYYGGVDDISIITPKFETNLEYIIPSKNIDKIGSFENTLIDYDKISKRDYFTLSPYSFYTGGDFPLSSVINNKLVSGKKILLVRDSFACVVAPFLSLSCSELDIIDLRHYTDSTLIKYIDKTNPDIVIFLYNPSVYKTDDGKQFTFN